MDAEITIKIVSQIVEPIATMGTLILGFYQINKTLKQLNKQTFINTITTARKEYLAEFRKIVAEFCITAVTENEEKTRLIELSYQLKMFMNPAKYPDKWDGEAVEIIDKIVQEKDKKDIDKFVALMQSWLSIEWEGMTNESTQGTLSDVEKEDLQKKHYKQYQDRIKEMEQKDTSD